MNSILVSDVPPYRTLQRWSIYLAVCLMAIAVAVLAGWQWDILVLRRPVKGVVAMNPLTAVGFLFSSLAYLFRLLPEHVGLQRPAGKLLALATLVIGAGCTAGFLFSPLSGMDQWLYAHRLKTDLAVSLSNRMAFNTALSFVLAGSLLLTRHRPGWSDAGILLIGTLALFSLVGYLYQVKAFYGPIRIFPMGVYAAGSFLLLTLAMLFGSARQSIMKVFVGDLAGSIIARTLIPFAFLVPVGLGLIRLLGSWHGNLSTETGVTLLVTSIITCFVFVIWYNALQLNKRDADRQRAELLLRASESRWKGLVSNVKDYAIFLVDPGGRVMSWNEGAEKIKGYRPDEVIGRPISIFYTAEEIERNEPAENLKSVMEKGTHHSEGWRVRKDGTRFWADIVFTAIYDERHAIQSFVKITRDTTEQKLAAEKIAYLARLIEDTSDAIFSTGADGAIRTWNKSAEALFGYRSGEVIGRQATDLMRPQLTEDVREPIRRQLEAEGIWKGEIVYLDRDGQRRTILQSVSNAREIDGRPGGYVIVGRDVTKWKEVEEQLREFNTRLEADVQEKTAELRQSNVELRALASRLQDIREEERASMAREVHDELGQQLTGLKMDLAMIVKKLPAADTAWLVDKAQATLQLLDTTIRTVRKIASDLRPSILDDLGLVAALDWQRQEFMKRSGIETTFRADLEISDLSPSVSIGLFRICQESLTNVARHSGAGHVSVSLTGNGEHLTLTVEDDGCGLDLPTAGGRGKTLGLLGMKERALMMGGTLTIKSKHGEGLVLSVDVPISPDHRP